ncbi:MAG: sensor histidine kinase, partial [Acidimicrobiia bacterium]
HRTTTDVAFALVVGVFSVAGYLAAERTGTQREQDVGGLAIVIAISLLLTQRRRFPLTVMAATVPLEVTFWIANYPTNFDVFPILTLYAATAHSTLPRQRVWAATAAAIAAYTIVALIGVIVPEEELPAFAFLGIMVIFGTSAVVGELVHQRRERLDALEERAHRAESERELLARQAVLDERARIARDLHDVVAHAMSVMVVQAGAAERLVEQSPDRARQALVNIQDAGRQALADMRRMLGVLREEGRPVELAPQPSMDEVHQIVQRCNESGVPTELHVDGDRPDRAVGPEMTGYRVVQESLTNVIKHGGRPVRAVVRISYRDHTMRVEVTDDGAGASSDTLARATGHGLVGMRERVELYGGTLHAGPRPGGGFRVAATIPLDEVRA